MSNKAPKIEQAFSLRAVSHHPVLGAISPDPAAIALGTGFNRFEGSSFAGLCREAAGCLDILAIVSQHNPGGGQLPLFINRLKARYRMIRFYEVMNKRLYAHLRSHGFTEFEEWGVNGPNLVWVSI